ncbi:hypothetical protein L914_15725 [Phytophthora nicotianae]|uniref:RxLR effector PexRD54 WY domain-containing protein n=2 Tax=Phytophthora nicotianae TaxID=4792 RepID=W2MND0_PHYNI|nr:hypothetical protein L914_15725 [Phytophthora nicotianae]
MRGLLLAATTFLVSIATTWHAVAEVGASVLQPTPDNPNGISSRVVRSHEERMPVFGVKNLLTSSEYSEKTLLSLLKSGESMDSIFVRLNLDKAKGELFNKPQFATLVKCIDDLSINDPKKGESMFTTVTTYYGDEALSQMIIAAQKDPSTKAFATGLQTRQLQYCLENERLPGYVLKRLELGKSGDNIFGSPQFEMRLTYLDDFNLRNPMGTLPRAPFLARYFGNEAFTKMVLDAMKTPSTANIASRFHAERMQHWLNTRKSPGDVYEFLSFHKEGENLVDNPLFLTWVKYVDDLNKVNPDKKTTLISVLAKHYDNDGLVKMLEAAKNVPGSSNIVKRLETEHKWLTKGTPDEVFKRLKLDEAGDSLLSRPQFQTWANYLKEYNTANPNYQTTLIETLIKHYGDAKLVKMLDEAMDVQDTKNMAEQLQTELFQRWMKNGQIPSEIFKMLNLDLAGNKLFTNPTLVTWKKYLSAFNREDTDKKTTLWATLRAHGYDDNSALYLLTIAKRTPNAKLIAASLQTEMLQYWLAAGKYPDYVFSLLRLNRAGDSLLTNPLFGIWIQYLDDFSVKFPGRTAMIPILRLKYDDISLVKIVESGMAVTSTENAARRVESELFKTWHLASLTPKDVFKRLKLNRKRQFDNPVIKSWMRFTTEYSKQKPHTGVTIIGTLEQFFGKDRLPQMIKTAKNDPSMEKVALELEHALLLSA